MARFETCSALQRNRGPRNRAFSLVEVMIAVGILGIAVLSIVTTMIGASTAVRRNSQALTAKNLAQTYFEKIAIDTFANIGPANYPNIAAPSPPYNMTSTSTVWIDKQLKIPCSVAFSFKGYGSTASGSGTTLTDNAANWTANEWKGSTLFIVSGDGAGQFVQIASNTSKQLTFASTLSFAPAAGDKYMINGGKTVAITISWTYRGRNYQQTVTSLIDNTRNESNLGF